MLGLTEVALAGLAVLVIGLGLRLRQQEPPAVARVAQELARTRAELAEVEERLVERSAALAPVEAELVELQRGLLTTRASVAQEEEELGRVAEALVRARAELDAAGVALAEQRARRAEAEAALREARRELDGRRADRPRVPDAPTGGRRLDLGAIVADAATEPPLTSTAGAVRPTGAIPSDPEQDQVPTKEQVA
jgi:hypothetical protein